METWHDDVQCFAVRSGEGEDLATFFLDVSQPTNLSLRGAVEYSPSCVPETIPYLFLTVKRLAGLLCLLSACLKQRLALRL